MRALKLLVMMVTAASAATFRYRIRENDTADDQRNCSEPGLPWLDLRAPGLDFEMRKPLTTPGLVFGMTVGIFTITANICLCILLCKVNTKATNDTPPTPLWSMRTYRMIFSLAVTDLLTGFLFIIGTLSEMKLFKCHFVMFGLWLGTTTSIYHYTFISVARWMMLNCGEFYKKHFGDKPAWTSIYGITCCWVLGLAQAIPLLTPWNDECASNPSTCSLPYRSPDWINGAALTVFIIPSIIIVFSYGAILVKIRAEGNVEKSVEWKVTKNMFLMTFAFLLVWWPLCIFLSYKWNTQGSTRGIWFGCLSSLINPILIMATCSHLKTKISIFLSALRARVCC